MGAVRLTARQQLVRQEAAGIACSPQPASAAAGAAAAWPRSGHSVEGGLPHLERGEPAFMQGSEGQQGSAQLQAHAAELDAIGG